jgi:hypothetical protein
MQIQNRVFAAAGLVGLLAAGTAFAEDGGDQAVFVFAQGGGINSTNHFDPFRDANFKTGYNVGGGVGVQLNRYVALRGSFLLARARAQDQDFDVPGLAGALYNRYIYSGDLQVGYPLRGGVTPYVVAGGGAMTFSNRTDPTALSFTRGFGKGGVGVNVDIPSSPLGIFVQGTGLIYRMNRFGPERTLFDASWTGGLRLRFSI